MEKFLFFESLKASRVSSTFYGFLELVCELRKKSGSYV